MVWFIVALLFGESDGIFVVKYDGLFVDWLCLQIKL